MPWNRSCDLYSAPGRLLIKLELGEAPEVIPASVDVRVGVNEAATTIDGGAVDRILKKFAGRVRVVRVHSARASQGAVGRRHHGFDDLEHVLGLSRTFRVDAEHACCIDDLVDALRGITNIEQAWPYYLCSIQFAESESEILAPERAWASREQINAASAMAHEPGDAAVIVAVVDTGVEASHPELLGRLRPGFDTVELGTDDLATGLQMLGDRSEADTDPEDEVGHGTSCATIIGGRGEKIPPGLAGACGILPIRVLGAAQLSGKTEPMGVGSLPDIDAGAKRAIDLGARVLNMSFGTPESALNEHDPLPHEDVVRYGLAHGCVMVAASGNSGKQERFSPACLDGVIAVGAADGDGGVTSFSTRGEHVTLCAPGERVVSAGLHGYQLVTGTSFAAPFVAATAALLQSRALRRSAFVDPAMIRQVLCASARPFSTKDSQGNGSGVLDAKAALRELDRVIDQANVPSRAGARANREANAHA